MLLRPSLLVSALPFLSFGHFAVASYIFIYPLLESVRSYRTMILMSTSAMDLPSPSIY